MTVMRASETMMSTMPVTTADVVAAPTAAELRPHWIPRRHPATATSTPNTEALMSPARPSAMWIASLVRT
jgi:NADPH-dependent ferric siderophore reductase